MAERSDLLEEEALRESEARYRYAFDAAAVCLWEQDFTGVVAFVEDLKARGIADIRGYLNARPDAVRVIARRIRVRDVNRATLRLFGADSTAMFISSVEKVITESALEFFKEALIALAEGRSAFSSDAALLTLANEERHFQITISFPAAGGPLDRVLATLVDITERDRAQTAHRRSEERYRAFVTNSSEGIWRYELSEPLDPSLPFEEQLEHLYRHAYLAEANDAMARMYGYPKAADVQGVPLRQMLPPEDPAAQAYLRTAIESGHRLNEVESIERDRDGQPRYFANSMIPVFENGKLVRAWGMQRDVTARHEAEATLARSEREVREANRRKDEFLATLAHELRNPLAPLRSASQLLKMPGVSESQARSAREIIERQIQHMVRLIDDLMDVSRITLGQVNLRHDKVNLGAVITDALDASRPAIEVGGHSLDVHLPPAPLYVEGDSTRLSQVFQNLLNNAAKYTPNGGRIALKARRRNGDVFVSVRDNGVGIEKDVQGRIFDLFTRVDPSHSIKVSGLGIGLALAKQLVERHHGRIEVNSAGAGHGSEFTVVLPLFQRSVPHHGQSNNGSSETSHTAARRVLVVDDNRDAAESLAMLLEASGCAVSTAFNGPEALGLLDSAHPEIVLLDIGMPGMDGYDVARRIRATSEGQSVFLVALTGWGQSEDKRRAAAAGFDEHVTKPIDPALLGPLLSRVRWART